MGQVRAAAWFFFASCEDLGQLCLVFVAPSPPRPRDMNGLEWSATRICRDRRRETPPNEYQATSRACDPQFTWASPRGAGSRHHHHNRLVPVTSLSTQCRLLDRRELHRSLPVPHPPHTPPQNNAYLRYYTMRSYLRTLLTKQYTRALIKSRRPERPLLRSLVHLLWDIDIRDGAD